MGKSKIPTEEGDREHGPPAKESIARGGSHRRAFERAFGGPFVEGNRVDILRNGDQIFPAMLEAIDGAERSIEFITYVYWTGEIAQKFADALTRAAKRGVEVAIVLDAFGAQWMREELLEQLNDAGVRLAWFRPKARAKIWQADNRTHRKVLICDGRVGFTGGVGIAEEWEGDARHPGEWRETHLRIEGPAVDGLHAAFFDNWIEAGRSLDELATPLDGNPAPGDVPVMIVRSTAAVGWSDAATVFRLLLHRATKRLRFTTAYFSPDQRATELLCAAAQRGVQVQVMVPSADHTDERVSQISGEAHYEQLLDCGVAIYRYTKTMIHAKVVTMDGEIAVCGSTNFNHRSMRKDEEVCAVMAHGPTVDAFDSDFEADLKHCEAIAKGDWEKRGIVQRVTEAVVHPFRHEM